MHKCISPNTWIFIQFLLWFVEFYYVCRFLFQLVIRTNHCTGKYKQNGTRRILSMAVNYWNYDEFSNNNILHWGGIKIHKPRWRNMSLRNCFCITCSYGYLGVPQQIIASQTTTISITSVIIHTGSNTMYWYGE